MSSGRSSTASPPARLNSGNGAARPLLEICIAYAFILATIWTARPTQQWLYLASVAWIVFSTWLQFPGWAALGFRRSGFRGSLWVVFCAVVLGAIAAVIAAHAHTLRHPHSFSQWVFTFGGYVIWSFAQQFLLQGYFLYRLLQFLPRREVAALTAAAIFSAAHLPNPILTPLTLVWGVCACFVFLRCRNLIPLAVTHALLGITVATTVPGPVIHNMRVGLGYLHYKPPDRSRPPLPQALP